MSILKHTWIVNASVLDCWIGIIQVTFKFKLDIVATVEVKSGELMSPKTQKSVEKSGSLVSKSTLTPKCLK